MLLFGVTMANQRDRILIVAGDPVISDVIGRQTLLAAGYTLSTATNAAEAITRAQEETPELIIADIDLPGLSGKDLLVALNAHKISIPVIVLGRKGQEAAIIQTFRLGAADYLLWPVREPEIISAVERLLKQAQERRERERLTRQVQQGNAELQMRVRELTTIFSLGKAVTTVMDQSALFDKILDGALSITQADLGWFLVADENSKRYMLAAQRNLPRSVLTQGAQPLDDGISSLVSMSGEALSIYGEPLRRFRVSSLGQSALIAPIKVQKQTIGLLVMMRKQLQPFNTSEQHLLEAVADYASISLVNARLFRVLEERARSMQALMERAQTAEKIGAETLQVVRREMISPLEEARSLLERMMKDPAWWSTEQRKLLVSLREQVDQLALITGSICSPAAPLRSPGCVKELINQSIDRMENFARNRNLSLNAQLPNDSLEVDNNSAEIIAQVLDGFISNAIKTSQPGGKITLRLEKTRAAEAHISVSDCGPGLDPRQVAHIFEKTAAADHRSQPFGGLGIGLPLIHELVTGLHGKTWVESKPGQGTNFHFVIPIGK
jgi:signal transduction histidine kinase/DNA-binding response OmpR family regulator